MTVPSDDTISSANVPVAKKRKRSVIEYGTGFSEHFSCCRKAFCYLESKGLCKFGKNCPYSHIGRKQAHLASCGDAPSTMDRKPSTGSGKTLCWYFQTEHNGGLSCTYGDTCPWEHRKLSAEEFQDLAPPAKNVSKLCWYFQTEHNGGLSCTYGDTCPWEHRKVSAEEFRELAPPAKVVSKLCWHFQTEHNGGERCGYGDKCSYQHRKISAEEFNTYFPAKKNGFGDISSAEHRKLSAEDVRELAPPTDIASELCWYFQTEHNGGEQCEYGDKCSYQHRKVSADEFKTLFRTMKRVCWHFQTDLNGGKICKYGDQCVYEHRKASDHEFKMWFPWQGRTPENTFNKPCPLFQTGSCLFGEQCIFKHAILPPENNLKLALCEHGDSCLRVNCSKAHSRSELETPTIYEDMAGYKAVLCTWYLTDGLECDVKNCFHAHGLEELRKQPLSVPKELQTEEFRYSDAHVHLDQVLWSRKYGPCFFYKFKRCIMATCQNGTEWCWFLHDEKDRMERPLDEKDFVEFFVKEIRSINGKFAGCVHSCCESHTIDQAVALVEWGRKHLDGLVYVCFGIHPSNFEDYTPELEDRFLATIKRLGSQVVAWGECGLEYYRRRHDIKQDPAIKQRMKDVFAKQARLAVKLGLTLVVHSRDAEEDTMQILSENVPSNHPVYMHSFMGSTKMMHKFINLYPAGFIGVTGSLSYEALGEIPDWLKQVPMDMLLLETDGPYMAPLPYRGEESHAAHIPWTAKSVADLRSLNIVDVLAINHKNFLRAFHLDGR